MKKNSGGGGGDKSKKAASKKATVKKQSRKRMKGQKRKRTAFLRTPYDLNPTKAHKFNTKAGKQLFTEATKDMYLDPKERYNLEANKSLG